MIKFPILPEEARGYMCAWCGTGHKLVEPNSIASISCGAILYSSKKRDSGGPSDKMGGYLSISWHGAHSDEGGIGDSPDTFVDIPLRSEVVGGQMDINFCSTECLRAFLNNCVDELELRISEDINSDS
jgi:hypothetical protein